PPFILLPKPEHRARYDNVLAKRADVEAALTARRKQAPELIANWLAGESAPRALSTEALLVQLRFDEQSGATFKNSAPNATFATVTASGGVPFWGEDTWFWPSYRMDT